jgi:hypothetical protein
MIASDEQVTRDTASLHRNPDKTNTAYRFGRGFVPVKGVLCEEKSTAGEPIAGSPVCFRTYFVQFAAK